MPRECSGRENTAALAKECKCPVRSCRKLVGSRKTIANNYIIYIKVVRIVNLKCSHYKSEVRDGGVNFSVVIMV